MPSLEEATENQPRLFVNKTMGGGGQSEALLRQLRAGDVLVSCVSSIVFNLLKTMEESIKILEQKALKAFQ